MSVPPGRSPNHNHNHPYHNQNHYSNHHRTSRRSLHAALLAGGGGGSEIIDNTNTNSIHHNHNYNSSDDSANNNIVHPPSTTSAATTSSALDFNFDLATSSPFYASRTTLLRGSGGGGGSIGDHDLTQQQQQHEQLQQYNQVHTLMGISPREYSSHSNNNHHPLLFHPTTNSSSSTNTNSRLSIGSNTSNGSRRRSLLPNGINDTATSTSTNNNYNNKVNGNKSKYYNQSYNNKVQSKQQQQQLKDNKDDDDEEDDDDVGGVLANAIPPPKITTTTSSSSTSSNTKMKNNITIPTTNDPTNNHENKKSNNNMTENHNIMSLSSIQKLRNLAQSTLMNSPSTFSSSTNQPYTHSMTSSTTSTSNYQSIMSSSSTSSHYSINSSSTAVFYTSILYTKTKSIYDAYLYAKALCYNYEYKRAIGILDHVGLLNFNILLEDRILKEEVDDPMVLFGTTTQNNKRKQCMRLIIESIILACYCWTYLGEWEEVSSLLEYFILHNPIIIQHLDHANYYDDLDKGSTSGNISSGYNHEEFMKSIYWKTDYDIEDEEVLCRLAYYIHETVDCDNDINPISRLCFIRGRACDEGNNPHRAVTFLKLALWIDVKCIEAWQYLCKRRLLTWEQERELIYSLRFDDANAGAGVEWLRDVYLASMTHSGLGITSLDPTVEQKQYNASTPIMSSTIGASPMMPVLPEQTTPQLNIDASAIKFQPTPTTGSFHMNGNNVTTNQSTFTLKPSPSRSQSGAKSNVLKEQEEAFRNLKLKHDLSESPEILAIAATRAYNSYNLPLALHYCQILHEIDPLCAKAASIQIATLTGLGHKRPLFRLAHALVEADPKSAMAWYAVGCYYYCCGRYDMAQRHFSRSIRLDDRVAECWVAYGCAFASCDENDQANTCFRHAQRLYSGSHYPMLYMGMEHLRTNNIPLSGHFLNSARSMSKSDPLCCNELGTWAYRKKEWDEASKWFVLALRLYIEYEVEGKKLVSWDSVSSNDPETRKESETESAQQISSSLSDRDCIEFCEEEFWEPTVFNLGQSYRKARRFEDASLCFEKCLALCPVCVLFVLPHIIL